MSNESDKRLMVTLSDDTRQKLQKLANQMFDDDEEVPFNDLINKLADERLSQKEAEEQAIEAKRDALRERISRQGDSSSGDDDALSDDTEAAEKQQALRESFGQ